VAQPATPARADTAGAFDLAAIKAGEPDRYLAALLAPSSRQPALLALAAFVADVAAIPSRVSQPMLGEIRLQWWRDAVATLSEGGVSGNPRADALGPHIRGGTLPAADLLRVIDARSHDLTGELFATEALLARYLADSEGVPMALAARLAGDGPWPEDLVRSAGVAYGLARGFCRLPALLHNGGVPLTAPALLAGGLTGEDLLAQPVTDATRQRFQVMAAAARATGRAALAQARRSLAGRPPAARTGGLPLALVEPYFAAQQRSDLDVLTAIVDVLPLQRVWRLAKARISGRI
jgi:phytoene synthase